MAWTTKKKRIVLAAVTQHTAPLAPGVIGRAPSVCEIRFSPQELFGAMARCSHLHPINPDAATSESESCRRLVSHHVDELPDDFSILESARRLKDFSRTHLMGVVGGGIAYLQMIRDGYVWCDHFENLPLSGSAPTKRSPDFVFSRPGRADVAIAESKATHGTTLKSFTGRVGKGYLEQVEPYLGMTLGGAPASHGFTIGSWMTSPTGAQLVIDHTAVPSGPTPLGTDPGDATAIKRGNYLTVCALMFGADAAYGARVGVWPTSKTAFIVAGWLGREWVVGSYDNFHRTAVLTKNTNLDKEVPKPSVLPTNLFALERGIADLVFDSLASSEDGANPLAEVRPIDENLQTSAQRSGGAIFPDGFAVIGKAEDLENVQILIWNPTTKRIEEIEEGKIIEVEMPPEVVREQESGSFEQDKRENLPLQILQLTALE